MEGKVTRQTVLALSDGRAIVTVQRQNMRNREMSSYKILADRIRGTTTLAGVERVEKSITRVYKVGFLTANELARLFVLSMDHAIKISEERVKVALSAIEIEGDA